MLETLPTWIIEIFKMLGITGAIFIIWFISNKTNATQFTKMFDASVKQFEQLINSMNDNRVNEMKAQRDTMRELFDVNRSILALITEMKIERKRDYEDVREIKELMQIQTQLLAEIKSLNAAHHTALSDIKSEMRTAL